MKRATVTINLVEEEGRGGALREQSVERCHYYKGEQTQIQSKNTNTYTNTVGNMDKTTQIHIQINIEFRKKVKV